MFDPILECPTTYALRFFFAFSLKRSLSNTALSEGNYVMVNPLGWEEGYLSDIGDNAHVGAHDL